MVLCAEISLLICVKHVVEWTKKPVLQRPTRDGKPHKELITRIAGVDNVYIWQSP